jgi:broad specificity phosphatase PhoE
MELRDGPPSRGTSHPAHWGPIARRSLRVCSGLTGCCWRIPSILTTNSQCLCRMREHPSSMTYTNSVGQVPPRHDVGLVLWLVPHGQTTWNSMGWVQGHVDRARFTRAGRMEIYRVADQLSEEAISAVYSSDLSRAHRTAMAIGRRLSCGVQTDFRLRERRFGVAEGVPWTTVPSALSGIANGRVVDEMARPPGGETLHDVYTRCLSFMLDLVGQSNEGDVVVVAHDGSLRMLRAIVADVEPADLEWGSDMMAGAQRVRLDLPMKGVLGSACTAEELDNIAAEPE